MSERLAKKVLLVGWDAADWKVINPLMDAGEMPALESLVNQGVMGNLATLDPPLSPMMWTSIATGMHADKHGILGFIEPAPKAQGVRPVMTTSRKVKAIWNILMQNGLKIHVVGWWPGHPAEPVNGIYISNHYQRAHSPIDKPWPLQPGTVHPKAMESVFDQLRIHPAELTGAHILPFVPDLAKIDQEKDKRVESLARIIADAATIHNAATYILENETWDFVAVYYDAIDHFGHGFMHYHPPKMAHVPQEQYDLYRDVVNSGYRFHDLMLARLIELAGPDTTVVLVSDHGFHSDHLRPMGVSKVPAGPADQHSPYGIFCMKGPHIRKDERLYGATLLDVTPTLLPLFGLPVGKDMDGHTLVQAFEEGFIPEMIDSWEAVEGECGMHPKDLQEDPWASQEAMEQLIALGYIDKPDENRQKAIDNAVNESQFYLARVYVNKSKFEEALPIIQKLWENEKQSRFGFQLARCLLEMKRYKESQAIMDIVRIRAKEEHDEEIKKQKEEAKKRLEEAKKKLKEEGREPDEKLAEQEKGLEQRQKKKGRPFQSPQLELMQGRLDLETGKYMKALESLEKVEKTTPRLPGLHQQLGQVYLKMKLWNKAEGAFNKALSIDPQSAHAYNGLADTYIRQLRYVDGAEAALNAIGLLYHYPRAHFNLGLCLARLKRTERAAEAFEVCLKMAPNMKRARRLLVRLYKGPLKTPEKAEAHQKIMNEESTQ